MESEPKAAYGAAKLGKTQSKSWKLLDSMLFWTMSFSVVYAFRSSFVLVWYIYNQYIHALVSVLAYYESIMSLKECFVPSFLSKSLNE